MPALKVKELNKSVDEYLEERSKVKQLQSQNEELERMNSDSKS